MDKANLVLKELEELSKKLNLPSLGEEKAKILKNLVKEFKPKRILEIGTLYGYSAIVMALAYEKTNIVTIEINKKTAETAKKYIKKAGLSKRIKVVVGDALKVIDELKSKFDMLFIDAIKEEYLDYLKKAEKKLKKGAIVIADNTGVFKHYLKDYLDYVRNSGLYKSYSINVKMEFSEIDDAMEVSEKLF
ncbi:MAG: class I SAM-dependent methyltransferase [Candidatus Aenigmarchaeota archaeon]|nr:tRNA (adenine(22)-N(1))-methyltransferase TrmK [Candidatus Aenigmarchaeota archaeon]MDW8149284.1 class I SAM-dependent methyltransferase [Candidatus Aenigmarchaeota archaeon]